MSTISVSNTNQHIWCSELRLEGLPFVAEHGRLLTSLELFMNLSTRFTSPSLATYLVPDVDVYLP
jgi:hypothetical protein